MRILFLMQWFDPEPTFKGLAFAKQLVEAGHEVEVLTGFPNYPEGKLYEGYRLRLWQREVVEEIEFALGAVRSETSLRPPAPCGGAEARLPGWWIRAPANVH